MPSTERYLRLPLAFDVARLQQDLARLPPSAWSQHFNTQAYDHGWSCLPLRSVGGSTTNNIPQENGDFQATTYLRQCPYFCEVLNTFECEQTSVRLMALAPGGSIKEHRDPKTASEFGITRLHIPIQTSPDVLFRIDGESVHFSAGGTWYLNATCLHSVRNPSTRPRVHLMLDCINNAWLDDVLQQSGAAPVPVHPYPDPNINDSNVAEVIAQLRASALAQAWHMAGRLESIRQQQSGAQTYHGRLT